MEENYKLAKWLNDEMTDSELKEFQLEEDYAIYEKIKKYSSELTVPDFKNPSLLNNVIESKKKAVKVVPLYKNWMVRIAAILVIGFGLFFTFTTISTHTEFAENGKKTQFSLPDQSTVILNSGSEIEYKDWNWDNNRNIDLKGEAYFKVAKGKKFKVQTDLGMVSVLGTQFDVKARNKRFDVTCYEGRVKVDYKNQEVIITKGETVSFENDVKIIHQKITDSEPLWKNKQIAFEKEQLINVFEEIQRQYDIKIEAPNVISNQLYSGKIPCDDLDVALQLITTSYHLKIKKINTKNYRIE